MKRQSRAGLLLVAGFLSCVSLNALSAQAPFVRGDVDSDGVVNVKDATGILGYLFEKGQRAVCIDALDVNDNSRVEISDAIRLLSHLFSGGPAPEPPFGLCGPDPTDDELSCGTFSACPYPLEELARGASGIFFVVDRSGSMQNAGELQLAQAVITEHLASVEPDTEFGIVFFDRSILAFPARGIPARATPENIAAATSWVESVRGGGGSCVSQGLLTALEFANEASGEENVIIYIGDGGGTCNGANEQTYLEQTLRVVEASNQKDAIIHCIGVLSIGTIQGSFLERLAEENGGRFVQYPQ